MALRYTANSPLEQAILDAGYTQGFGEGGAGQFRSDPANEALVQQFLKMRSSGLTPVGNFGSLQYSGPPSTSGYTGVNPAFAYTPNQRQQAINTFGDQQLGYDPITGAIVGDIMVRTASGDYVPRTGTSYNNTPQSGAPASPATPATPATPAAGGSGGTPTTLRYIANSPLEQAILNAGYGDGFGAGGAGMFRQTPANEALVQKNLGAYNQALSEAQNYVTGRGLNYGEFGSDIEKAIMDAFRGVSPGSTNPSSYFDKNLAANALGNIESNRRSQYTNEINKLFGATDSGASVFGDTADDAIINAILEDQYGSASKLLDNSRARGVLNDTGYNEALKRLGNQRTTASSNLQKLGGTVLSTNRQKLDDIANAARTAAGGYTLGSSFDPSGFKTRFDTTKNELTGTLEGDIRSAIGDSNLFDVSSATQFGGQAQGAQNTRAVTPYDILTNNARSTGTNKRGVGNTGVF